MSRHEAPKNVARSPRLRAAAALLAAGAALAGAGCSSTASTTAPHERPSSTAPAPQRAASHLNLFVPTGDTAQQYANIARTLRGAPRSLGEVTLAFADVSANGLASPPPPNPGLVKLVDGLPKTTEVAVAYDGSLPPYTSLTGILSHPGKYVASVLQTQRTMQGWFPGHSVKEADLDFEYPPASKQGAVSRIVRGIRKGGLGVTVEAGPGNMQGLNLRRIAKDGATIDIMALDNALGVPTAQPNAAGMTAISDTQDVIQAGVPADQISVEFPAFGQTFPGATRVGDRYDMRGTTEIPDRKLICMTSVDNSRILSSFAEVGHDTLVSWQSPSDIQEVLRRVAALGITGDSLWEADQAPLPVVDAAMTP
jgi:hypothetical protein